MISKEEVLKIAKLAKLSVKDEEIEGLTSEMSRIIEYAHIICSIEDADVDFENLNNIENAFNEDDIVESFDVDDVLKNREGGENGYFVVRKNLRG